MTNEQIKTLLLLAIAFAIIAIYAMQPTKWALAGVPLEKANFSALIYNKVGNGSGSDADFADRKTALDYKQDNAAHTADEDKTQAVDSSAQTVLLIGDSMIEGLARRFANYAKANNHKLYTIVWYGSTTKSWAETNTLDYFIKLRKPTYIVVCLGSNELFVNDLDLRRTYVAAIRKKIGTIPYVWIGAPDWKGDTGINDMIEREVGNGRYFDSRQLVIKRGSDNIHPTFSAAALWADSVAQWMSSGKTLHPLELKRLQGDNAKCNFTLLQPDFKGY